MGNTTGIEWTDATWNPIRGCSRVSEGCRNCYAERVAHRFSGPGQPYEGLTQIVNGHPVWTGKVQLVEKHLLDPLKWKGKPMFNAKDGRRAGYDRMRIFVNSMSDLFHPNVPDEWIAKIVAVMVRAHKHVYQILTKRPERMQSLLSSEDFWRMVDAEISRAEGKDTDFLYDPPCAHIHWGVSVEDQKTADARIPLLLQTPAAVRFISAEPLLGPIDADDKRDWLTVGFDAAKDGFPHRKQSPGLDWVIVGGESGPGARPMHPDWARGLRDQCVAAGVPFFFKQWGEHVEIERRNDLHARPWMVQKGDVIVNLDGTQTTFDECGGIGNGIPMRPMRKKAAGSLLDGRAWKEFPQ